MELLSLLANCAVLLTTSDKSSVQGEMFESMLFFWETVNYSIQVKRHFLPQVNSTPAYANKDTLSQTGAVSAVIQVL